MRVIFPTIVSEKSPLTYQALDCISLFSSVETFPQRMQKIPASISIYFREGKIPTPFKLHSDRKPRPLTGSKKDYISSSGSPSRSAKQAFEAIARCFPDGPNTLSAL